MARARKDHECLNIKLDASLYHRLSDICADSGMTKTSFVEHALAAFILDYDKKQSILEQAEAGLLVPVGKDADSQNTEG